IRYVEGDRNDAGLDDRLRVACARVDPLRAAFQKHPGHHLSQPPVRAGHQRRRPLNPHVRSPASILARECPTAHYATTGFIAVMFPADLTWGGGPDRHVDSFVGMSAFSAVVSSSALASAMRAAASLAVRTAISSGGRDLPVPSHHVMAWR